MLLALASCSDVAASYLTATNGKAVSQLLEWASWGLCYLECGTMLLLRAWNSGDAAAASACLLEPSGSRRAGSPSVCTSSTTTGSTRRCACVSRSRVADRQRVGARRHEVVRDGVATRCVGARRLGEQVHGCRRVARATARRWLAHHQI